MSDKVLVTPNKSAGVTIHAQPDANSSSLGKFYIGDQLELVDPSKAVIANIGKAGAWLEVRAASGVQGHVDAQKVQRAYDKRLPDEPTEPLFIHTNASDGLRIRSGPSAKDKVLVSVFPSEKLEVVSNKKSAGAILGQKGEWIQVRTSGGLVGWGSAAYLEYIPEVYSWSQGHALVGLHGPADPGDWPWDESAFRLIRDARIKAVKIHSAADIGPRVVNRLRQEGVEFIMARLFAKFAQPRSAQDFVNEIKDATLRLHGAGVRYFEVHNEPNLHTNDAPEGMNVAWRSGKEFGQFFLDSVAMLKKLMPDAQFGFPGVSPGPDVPNVRQSSDTFLASADEAVRCADFVCMHTYWGADGTSYLDSINKVRAFCEQYPSQLVFVTEFSNADAGASKEVKGREYASFYADAKKLPSNLGGLFSYVMQSSSGFGPEVWRDSPIVAAVGSRPQNV